MQSEALLVGRLFDDRGNRMSPTHARKGGIKYRYYLSSALIDGRSEQAGRVSRVPAAEIETIVARSAREHLNLSQAVGDKTIIDTHVRRVEIHPQQLSIHLCESAASDATSKKSRSFACLGKDSHQSGDVKFFSRLPRHRQTLVPSARRRAPH